MMEYVNLSNCHTYISEVSLGTHTFSGDCWGEPDDNLSTRTISASIDVGINMFDTAHSYGLGHAEEVLGNALKGQREKAYICTKVGTMWNEVGKRWTDFSYDSIIKSAEQSLKRLRTDYIDFYFLHFPDPKIDIQESLGAMVDLVARGMVRYIGVSRFRLDQLKRANEIADISVVQYPVNIFDRQFGMQPGFDEIHKTKPIMDFCNQEGIGFMAYGALAKGLLTDKLNNINSLPKKDWRRSATRFQKGELEKWISVRDEIKKIAESYNMSLAQLAINWTLSHSGVVTSIIGSRNPEQIIHNIGASGVRLLDRDMKGIEEIMDKAGHCPDFYSE